VARRAVGTTRTALKSMRGVGAAAKLCDGNGGIQES